MFHKKAMMPYTVFLARNIHILLSKAESKRLEKRYQGVAVALRHLPEQIF